MRHYKIFLVISLLTGLVVFFIRCDGKNSWKGKDPRGNAYAGSEVCGSCHHEIAGSYAHNHHFQTSATTDAAALARFVTSTNNSVRYDDSSEVRVAPQGSSFFQYYIDGGQTLRSARLDIAVGSAEKAQTFGYWRDKQLFELPLTYLTGDHRWISSPGFSTRKPYFDRVIESRCLECHASFASKDDVPAGPLQTREELHPESIVFGIDCERCHGPSAKHVAFQQENPTVKQARFVTPIRALTRQQKLDLCASCHSGNEVDVQRTMFEFVPGDTLANFLYPHFGTGAMKPDVHGKQMQLLEESKCFQQSGMTCLSCHDTHASEQKGMNVFVSKCMTCHQNSQHAVSLLKNDKNCIDCHMPLQASKAINFSNGMNRDKTSYLLRTHRIAVYKDLQ